MPVHNGKHDSFKERLRGRQQDGQVARAQIIEQLSAMTVEELRKVKPSIFARLGPHGCSALAAKSHALRGQDGRFEDLTTSDFRPKKIDEAPHWRLLLNDLRRRRPLWWEVLNRLAFSIIIAFLIVTGAPLAERLVSPASLFAGVLQCTRLDQWTGNCVYVTGSDRLMLADAAAMLRFPLGNLAASNSQLDLQQLIPSGTPIRVPRRTLLNLR